MPSAFIWEIIVCVCICDKPLPSSISIAQNIYGTAREQVYIKLRALARALAEFLRVLASDLRALARASQSLCSRVTCVHTPIARVRNTRERLSMHVRNTNLSAREQCKHVPRYVRILSCTTSSSSF